MKKLYQDVKKNFALNVEQLKPLKPIIRFISKEQTKEIIKLIEEDIGYCKSKLTKDFEKDKIWKWRIEGFEYLKRRIVGVRKR